MLLKHQFIELSKREREEKKEKEKLKARKKRDGNRKKKKIIGFGEIKKINYIQLDWSVCEKWNMQGVRSLINMIHLPAYILWP